MLETATGIEAGKISEGDSARIIRLEDELLLISRKLFSALAARLSSMEIAAEFSDRLILEAVKEGGTGGLGARPLKRAIQRIVEDPLSEKIISGEVSRGDRVSCDYDEAGGVLLVKKEESDPALSV